MRSLLEEVLSGWEWKASGLEDKEQSVSKCDRCLRWRDFESAIALRKKNGDRIWEE